MSADHFYRLIVRKTMKDLQVSSYTELYTLASLDTTTFNQQMCDFSQMLNQISSWSEDKKEKYISFLADEDTLTNGYFQDRDYYNFPTRIYRVKNSSHCCYNISFDCH